MADLNKTSPRRRLARDPLVVRVVAPGRLVAVLLQTQLALSSARAAAVESTPTATAGSFAGVVLVIVSAASIVSRLMS